MHSNVIQRTTSMLGANVVGIRKIVSQERGSLSLSSACKSDALQNELYGESVTRIVN